MRAKAANLPPSILRNSASSDSQKHFFYIYPFILFYPLTPLLCPILPLFILRPSSPTPPPPLVFLIPFQETSPLSPPSPFPIFSHSHSLSIFLSSLPLPILSPLSLPPLPILLYSSLLSPFPFSPSPFYLALSSPPSLSPYTPSPLLLSRKEIRKNKRETRDRL